MIAACRCLFVRCLLLYVDGMTLLVVCCVFVDCFALRCSLIAVYRSLLVVRGVLWVVCYVL